MRIVVMGAGGVGGYFGAKLARGGHAVTLVARGAHLEAIRRDGLRVRSAVEGEFVASPDAVGDLGGQPPADAVLLCVKGFDTETALEQLRPVVGPATPVLSLQNGVSSAEVIDRVLGPGHAVGGAAYVFAVHRRPRGDRPPAARGGSPSGSWTAASRRAPKRCATPWPAPASPWICPRPSGACSGRSISSSGPRRA